MTVKIIFLMEGLNPPQMKYQQRPNLLRAVITSALPANNKKGKIKTQQNSQTIRPLFLKTKA